MSNVLNTYQMSKVKTLAQIHSLQFCIIPIKIIFGHEIFINCLISKIFAAHFTTYSGSIFSIFIYKQKQFKKMHPHRQVFPCLLLCNIKLHAILKTVTFTVKWEHMPCFLQCNFNGRIFLVIQCEHIRGYVEPLHSLFHGRFPLPIRSTRSSWLPKFPDQAQPTAVHDFLTGRYLTVHDPHMTTHDSSTTLTRQPPWSLLDHPDLYTISARLTRNLFDLVIDLVIHLSWGIGQIEVKLIRYWSLKFFYPNQTRSLHDRKETFPDQLDHYSTNTQSLPDGFSSTWHNLYSNFLDMSKIFR